MKLPEDNWLVKTNRFLIGDFIFMLNVDWMAKKQLDISSINHFFKKQKKHLKRNQNFINSDLK